MTFWDTLKGQLKLLFKRKAFYLSFAIFYVYNMYSAFQAIYAQTVNGNFLGDNAFPFDYLYIPAAHAHTPISFITYMGFLTTAVALLICVIPFADSLFVERSSGLLQIALTKTKRIYYYVSKIITVFIGNLIVFTLPLIANQLVLFSFYKYSSYVSYDGIYTIDSPTNQLLVSFAAIPELISSHPYIYNILSFILFGLFMGLIACFAMLLPARIVKLRVITLCIPFLLNVVFTVIDNILDATRGMDSLSEAIFCFSFDKHLTIMGDGNTVSLLVIIFVLIASIVFLLRKNIKDDVLD